MQVRYLEEILTCIDYKGQRLEGKIRLMMMRLSVPADEDLQRALSFFEKVFAEAWMHSSCGHCLHHLAAGIELAILFLNSQFFSLSAVIHKSTDMRLLYWVMVNLVI